MHFAGMNGAGRIATRLATMFALPHKAGVYLAYLNPRGYIAPTVVFHHSELRSGENIFIGDRVIIYQARDGGPVEIGDRACVLRDTALETGYGGYIIIGPDTWIHPRCQVNAYVEPIEIGKEVDIAPNCAFYSYDHGFTPDRTIRQQPLRSKGGIFIGDHSWLGVGVTVLNNVRIGKGAVIGAGSVVTRDIPEGAIAVGNPARVVRMRGDLSDNVGL